MTEPVLPPVFIPEDALSVESPDGRSLVFLRLPQLDVPLKQVLASQPEEFTYRWGYHAGHRLHVLFVYWPAGDGVQVGIGIPEGPGDGILAALEGESDIFLTTEPLPERRDVFHKEDIERLTAGLTVPLVGVQFGRRRTGPEAPGDAPPPA